jgi:AcrR family transcriptional regulator
MATRKRSTKPARRPALQERAIMRATLEELARSDYGGLSIEQVASRARVNKTTVYRHWPTKADLVRSALSSVAAAHDAGPSSGSLRRDLVTMARVMVEFASSFEGQSLIRLRLLDNPEPELAAIASTLQATNAEKRAGIIRQAIARGEVRRDADPALILDMLAGALHFLLFIKKRPVDDRLIGRIVDALLHGALVG